MRGSPFPAGSVGSGLATNDSDLDATIYFESNHPDRLTAIEEAYDQVLDPQDENTEHLDIYSIDSLLNTLSFRVVPVLAGGNRKQLIDLANIFAPTINETTNPVEHETANRWRRQLLEKISQQYPGREEEIWNHIRALINEKYIQYEKDTSGGGSLKRQQRVKSALNKTISQRFPRNRRAQERALKFILAKRRSLSYPSYAEMKQIFGLS